MSARYGTINRDYAVRMATTEPADDGPIWMVNFMKYRARADYPDGRESTISGREADDLYAPLDVLAAIGAEIAFFGEVVGREGGQPDWDRIAIVRYPTRCSFIEMQSRPDFQERHVHKEAGMEFTILLAALPAEAPDSPPDPGGLVRLTAYRSGEDPPLREDGMLRFAIEGLVVGDDRRFGHLDVGWAEDSGPVAPAGGMSVTTTRVLDRILNLLLQAA